MHSELSQIIELVLGSTEPVEVVVEKYMASVTWTILKDEYEKMNRKEKKKFLHKLTVMRNVNNVEKLLRDLKGGK